MPNYLDIHTHHYQSVGDSRMSYRPTEPLLGPGLYSLGLHPCYPEDMQESALALLRSRLSSEQALIWAIGEAGLDKLSPVPLERQLHYLEAQIELSEALGLPLVLHCVRAYNELMALRKRLRPRQDWIIHGYRRGAELAESLLRAGFYLSFGQHYDAEALRLAYEANRLYLETDEAPIDIEEVYRRAMHTLGLASMEVLQQYIREQTYGNIS